MAASAATAAALSSDSSNGFSDGIETASPSPTSVTSRTTLVGTPRSPENSSDSISSLWRSTRNGFSPGLTRISVTARGRPPSSMVIWYRPWLTERWMKFPRPSLSSSKCLFPLISSSMILAPINGSPSSPKSSPSMRPCCAGQTAAETRIKTIGNSNLVMVVTMTLLYSSDSNEHGSSNSDEHGSSSSKETTGKDSARFYLVSPPGSIKNSSMPMRIKFAISVAVLVAVAVLAGRLPLMAQSGGFAPVTEEMLRNPAPGDWLNWKRTDNAWGYSPLDTITTGNVGQLQLVWSWAMDDTGAQEATPLVYDGIVYLPNPRGVIQALDGATGDLIWEYRPGITPRADEASGPQGGRPGGESTIIPRLPQQPTAVGGPGRGIQKNIAIYDDMIFGTTQDAHIVALDARTGRLVWDTTVADSSLGYQYTAGPLVVRGILIAGITGCSRYKDDVCFITGHDAATGDELWRTSTVARPGEPGGDTLGRSAAGVQGRQRRVDYRKLRRRSRSGLLGNRAGQALGPIRSRDRRRCALYEFHSGARSGNRRNSLVLPAPAR